MIPFVDIHSHNKAEFNDGSIRLNNILLHEPVTIGDAFFSAGWHPWYLDGHSPDEIEKAVRKAASKPNVLAIGECGLDKLKNTTLVIQKKIFKIHILIALEKQKPLIVHCVKCYSELLEILKNEHLPKTIIHRYSGNTQQLEQLLKYENLFFSLGAELLNENQKQQSVLKAIPKQRLFLETDDSDISIEKIYLRASNILNINIEALKSDILSNFSKIFNNELVKPH